MFLSLLISCGKDKDNPIETQKGTPVSFGEVKQISNLYAPSAGKGYEPSVKKGEFVKFSFKTGEKTTSETDWDIAFRYATILVNGGKKVGYDSEPDRTGRVGAYIAKNTFEDFKFVEEDKFKQDGTNKLAITDNVLNGKGIWSYNMKEHYVLPIPGRILVFKTKQGFVKMEVLSFYKDAKMPKPLDESYSYYTFKYSIEK